MFDIRRLSAADFLTEVVPKLAEREVENNLLIGLAQRVARDPNPAPDTLLAVVEQAGALVGAALRTPPHFVVVSPLPDGAERALADACRRWGIPLEGACGPGVHGERAARAFAGQTGAEVELISDEELYELTTVLPPRRPPGAARRAERDDLPAVIELFRGFFAEVRFAHPIDAEGLATRVVEEQRALLWEDGGVRSLACQARSTLTGAAIAPVYTPPASRRRGYGTALTAELTQSLLDAGKRFVCLHAERKNATSNHIYQSIGFRAAGPFQVWAVR